MALSKKQVKQLRAMANQLNPLLYIGKNDLTDAAVKQASETMDSHELLKVAVQDGSGLTAKEAADKLAGQIGAQVVQVIGNRLCCTARAHATTSSTSASYASDGGRIPRARIWLWPRHRYRVGATTIFSARAGHFFNDSVIVISGSSRETSNVASPVLLHVPWSVDSP